jgi:hypothetical protein
MMKNIFKISLIGLAVVLLGGCIKETFPKGSTVTEEQLTQSDGAISYMLSGIPSAMTKAGTGGFYSTYGWQFDFGLSSIHMSTEVMLEDIAVLSELGYFWYSGFYQNQGMGSDYALCSFFWLQYYEWIKLANDVIGVAGEITEETPEDIKAIVGQAYAYRAMYYLDLARIYEPKPNSTLMPDKSVMDLTVPIITENTTEEEAKNNPRAKREEMYQFILSDLEKAEEYLQKSPNAYTSPGLVAVYGLLARTYLELGATYKEQGDPTDWEEMTSQKAYGMAASYSRKAINKGLHTPLNQAQWEDPTNGFNNGAANNAWIWGLTVSSENVSNLIANVAHRSAEALYGYGCMYGLGVNLALYNQISDEDFRKHSWFDPDSDYAYRFAGGSVYQNGYLIHSSGYGTEAQKYMSLKFRPAGGNVLDYTTGNAADWPLMRIEEMYFIEIEAELNISGLAKAQELLNEFMQNYRYDSYDCTLKTMTNEAFIKELMLQRRIEFWGEGILFFDYKRLNQGINRGYTGTNIPAVATFNTPDRSPQWNVPITRGEYQSNKGIRHPADNNPDPTEKLILWK